MYLKYVQIVNFKNLKNVRFEFSKGANTIIGENDSGKSNALTAIRILLDDNYYYNTKRLKETDFSYALGDWKGHWIIISAFFDEISNEDKHNEFCAEITPEQENIDFLKSYIRCTDKDFGTVSLFIRPCRTKRIELAEAAQNGTFESVRSQIKLSDYEFYYTARSQADFTDENIYKSIVADGVLMETPSNQNNFNDGITGEALGGTSYESAPIISNSYYFSFADDNSQYILTVYGEASQIAELRQSFVSVLPILFCVILLVSLATAWGYSRIITNPVLKISRISKEMSDMRLEWQLEERRSDELGVLENSLNTLSRKLSATLEELQSANLQLQKDIEHQKALERAQQDFFSSASHELKTPITIIKGQLEGMLLGIGAYKDHEKYLARSLEVAATLETMVQEILTISRLETNVDFKMEHFDCAPMIHGYLREIDDLVATKELQIHLAIQSPAFINGNKLLIEKVFSNLISNAVKYSPHGASVDIILQNTNGRFLFSVENTGTHIPEDDIPKLFDAFYRMEQSRSRRTGGSGLGLYMVQRILQQHNSYCEACNTENGVKFFFTI